MKGRRAKPAELKAAQGNPGKRALPQQPADDQAPSSIIAPPKFLKEPAARVWRRLAPELARLKFLRQTDIDAFARYCSHIAHYWSLTRTLTRKGYNYTSKSKHGDLERMRPEFLVRERIEKHLIELEDRFGLTARARNDIMRMLSGLAPQLPLAGQSGQPAPTQTGDGEPAAPADPNQPPLGVGFLGTAKSMH